MACLLTTGGGVGDGDNILSLSVEVLLARVMLPAGTFILAFLGSSGLTLSPPPSGLRFFEEALSSNAALALSVILMTHFAGAVRASLSRMVGSGWAMKIFKAGAITPVMYYSTISLIV
jgi:hypothetical protein